MRRGLRTDVLRFGEREVAMVLDNETIEAGLSISLRISEGSLVDSLDAVAGMVRRARQRQQVHDADQHPSVAPKNRFQRMLALTRDRRDFAHSPHASIEILAAADRIALISSRDGNDARTPGRVTQIAAAAAALWSASGHSAPAARAATSVPQKTSPAPTVSIASTSGALTRNSPVAETSAAPSAPSVNTTARAPAPNNARALSKRSSPPPNSAASPRLTTTRSTDGQS